MTRIKLTAMTCVPSGAEWLCTCECGHKIRTPVRRSAFHACQASTPKTGESPSLATKARNFATSAVKHLAAGAPRCTQEQIDARFAICQTCEHFDGKACRQCGCPVVRERQFISKLSWAGEKCPAGKWGPVDANATVERERTADADAGPPLPPQR